jgi:Zn-dependent alcohol dehydrogenase
MQPPGMGCQRDHRCRRSRSGNLHPPVPTGHRPGLEGNRLWGAKGGTDVPKIVNWYMEKKINIDDLITHKLPLQDINKGFELMRAGESIRSVVVY